MLMKRYSRTNFESVATLLNANSKNGIDIIICSKSRCRNKSDLTKLFINTNIET